MNGKKDDYENFLEVFGGQQLRAPFSVQKRTEQQQQQQQKPPGGVARRAERPGGDDGEARGVLHAREEPWGTPRRRAKAFAVAVRGRLWSTMRRRAKACVVASISIKQAHVYGDALRRRAKACRARRIQRVRNAVRRRTRKKHAVRGRAQAIDVLWTFSDNGFDEDHYFNFNFNWSVFSVPHLLIPIYPVTPCEAFAGSSIRLGDIRSTMSRTNYHGLLAQRVGRRCAVQEDADENGGLVEAGGSERGRGGTW